MTTTTHYIKLTFQRDPANVPHYAELKALENEFNSVPYPGDCPTGYSVLKIFIGFMLCTIPGVLHAGENEFWPLLLGQNGNRTMLNILQSGKRFIPVHRRLRVLKR